MLDKLERFFNWQSDIDWTWGPLLRWRSARSKVMEAQFYWRSIYLIMWIVLVYVLLHVVMTLPSLLVGNFHPMLRAFSKSWNDVPSWFVPSLTLYVLSVLPYVWAWNRRADRLAKLLPEEPAAPIEGIWPPPPSVPFP